MDLADAHAHYRLDAELFDYFANVSPVDTDGARRIQEAVLQSVNLQSGDMVLDAGSGNGWLTRRRPDCPIVSVDLGLHNLLRLREILPSAMLVCADMTRLPFRIGVFDHVISSEALEHLNVPEAAIAAFAECSRPGGTLTASTPYREVIKTYLCIHCNKPTPANAHVQVFDEHRHESLFREAGYTGCVFRLVQNRLFVASRLSFLFRFLPYRLWRLIDQLFMFVSRKPSTIVVSGYKAS